MTATNMPALEALLNEVSSGLADVVEAMKDRAESGAMEEISATLVDLVDMLKAAKSKGNMDDMVAAIKALKIVAPDINVTVQPAVVQILEKAPACSFTINSIKYDRHGRLESATVSPVEE